MEKKDIEWYRNRFPSCKEEDLQYLLLYGEFSELPNGHLVKHGALKYISKITRYLNRLNQISVALKIRFFRFEVEKTNALKARLQNQLCVLSDLKNKYSSYSGIIITGRRVKFLLRMIKIGEQCRENPLLASISVKHQESTGLIEVIQYNYKQESTIRVRKDLF